MDFSAFNDDSVMHTLDLNGFWEFAFADKTALEDAADPDFTSADFMPVPGAFDTMPKWLKKKGTGLYRRTFILDKPVENAWLAIDGIGLRGEFRIDGRSLGQVNMPWSGVELETGPLSAGKHILFAAIDNRLDPERMKLFMPDYDFYSFGGFYRGVSLKFDNRRLFVRTRDYKTGTIEIEAVNFIKGDFDANLVFDGCHEVRAAFRNFRVTIPVPDFKLWSTEVPAMHSVRLISEGADVSARFGIREVKAADGKILLNGRELFLKGVNRHEMHPEFGPVTSETLMVQDVQLLKSLGVNFCRLPHYPADQRFLELCDESGILVWEESLGWGNVDMEMGDPDFIRLQIAQTDQMVRNSFNHPSVIIFAFMNELDSHSETGVALIEKLSAAIRKLDSGRLVSFATYHNTDDNGHVYSDLVSFNSYPGWIDWGFRPGETEDLRKRQFDGYSQCVRYYQAKYPGKPIIISETGACGIFGQHDASAPTWSEEFEAEYDGNAIDWALSPDSGVCGITIWQFSDSPSYSREHLNPGARGKVMGTNLGGIFDGYRREKLAARIVREKFK